MATQHVSIPITQQDSLLQPCSESQGFEVQMNVSDFQPDELKVSFNVEDRVVTVEGRHHEAIECQHGGHHGHHHHHNNNNNNNNKTHVDCHFKRSFTLAKTVLEPHIEARLSANGQQLTITALTSHQNQTVAKMTAPPRLCAQGHRSLTNVNNVHWKGPLTGETRG